MSNKICLWSGVIGLMLVFTNHQQWRVQAQLPPSPSKPIPSTEEIAPTTPTDTADSSLFQQVRIFEGQRSSPNSLSFSPDSQYVIAGGNGTDPLLRVWDVNSGKRRAQIRAQRSDVLNIAISPNGETLITSGADGILNAWNWNTGVYLGARINHNTQVLDLVISPDGSIAVSGALDGIRVSTLDPRRPLYQLASIGTPTSAVGINPTDGITLVSGNFDGGVKLWNLRTGVKLSEFSAHKKPITGVLFTLDGKQLITSSEDRTVKIWDANSKQLLYTLIGHTGFVRDIILHPNGQILASCSNDGVRLWDVSSGKLRQWIKTPDWVETVAFSPDGRLLAIGSFDFSVVLWQANSSVTSASVKSTTHP